MTEADVTTGSVSASRILGVARRRFEAVGYRRASIAEIAREAGVAAGTIYRHFQNKEDLLRRVVEASNLEWLEETRRVLTRPGTAPERLMRLGQASVEFNQRNRLFEAALSRDAEMIFPPLVEELHDKLLRENVSMMAEVIREGIEAGSFRPIDPEQAAFILFVAGRALFNERHQPYARILPLFAEITQKGMLPR